MPIPYRRELAVFLDEFAAHHRGVRRGQMFGLPAIYVGRRLCACLFEEGLLVRLPSEIARREIAAGARPHSRRGRPGGAWIRYEPRTLSSARRLAPLMEVAVRHLARRQTMTP
jgi:hypothetical protein